MAVDVANISLQWFALNMLEADQDLNANIDKDLENVLIQIYIYMFADQENTKNVLKIPLIHTSLTIQIHVCNCSNCC